MKKSVPQLSRTKLLRKVSRERGVVLIAAILILLVMTIMSISMFRSFNQQERISGNTREKLRAFHAAQTTLQFGESWLAQGNDTSATACTALLDANAATPTTQVCSDLLDGSQITAVPWQSGGAEIGVQYTPPNMDLTGLGAVDSYVTRPRFHIAPLGMDAAGEAMLYQVTAWSQGGNAGAVSVVQSVYAVKTGVINAGGL